MTELFRDFLVARVWTELGVLVALSLVETLKVTGQRGKVDHLVVLVDVTRWDVGVPGEGRGMKTVRRTSAEARRARGGDGRREPARTRARARRGERPLARRVT